MMILQMIKWIKLKKLKKALMIFVDGLFKEKRWIDDSELKYWHYHQITEPLRIKKI